MQCARVACLSTRRHPNRLLQLLRGRRPLRDTDYCKAAAQELRRCCCCGGVMLQGRPSHQREACGDVFALLLNHARRHEVERATDASLGLRGAATGWTVLCATDVRSLLPGQQRTRVAALPSIYRPCSSR